jgi:hypothetical protein
MTQPVDSVPYWSERLSLLLGTLTTELHASGPGTTASRRTTSGFTVALTLTPDGARRCRLSTEDRPRGEAAWKRWHEEIETMVQHLGVSKWQCVAATEAYTGAMMEFQERLTA